MASLGPNLNSSQILVTIAESISSLDEKQTVFGRAVEGLDVIDKINNILVNKDGKPMQNCRFILYL